MKIRAKLVLAVSVGVFFLFSSLALAQKPEAKKNFEKGMKYKQEGSNFQAREQFQKALEIDPNYSAARVELGGVYADLNMLEEASGELSKVNKSGKKVPKLHSYLGLVYYKLGLKEWTDLVQNDPEYMFKDKGEVKFIKDGTRSGIQIDKLKKKIGLDTTNFEARYWLRGMYYDLAIDQFKQALQDNPKDTLAYLTLGLTYLERGKEDLAAKQQEALEKIHPPSAKVLVQELERREQGKKEMEELKKGKQ